MTFRSFLRVSASLLALCSVSVALPIPLHASAVQAAAKANIDDTWQGTLHVDKDLRLVLKITKGTDGVLMSTFYSIDQGGAALPAKTTTFRDGTLTATIEVISGVYTGKMSADGASIAGEWKQGDKPLPLLLTRATAETAWVIPEPPKKVPPMAADADPSWDVATIRMSPPDAKGKNFGGPPRQFKTRNTTLNDLVTYSFDLSTKQLTGAPAWFESDHFDISTGEPDVPGAPSEQQQKAMLRKLLIDRFGLKFHMSKQEMSAYVLTVAKDGPKLTKSEGDHHGGPFYFTQLGKLVYRDNSMQGFCRGMQAWVFDRPVVDRTGLTGFYDGTLNWSPDETQFQAFGVKIVPNEAADAPPPVFTAILQQMGLKLEGQKTAVDVMVIDHVEKPSEN